MQVENKVRSVGVNEVYHRVSEIIATESAVDI
jgi:hypothetical protein